MRTCPWDDPLPVKPAKSSQSLFFKHINNSFIADTRLFLMYVAVVGRLAMTLVMREDLLQIVIDEHIEWPIHKRHASVSAH